MEKLVLSVRQAAKLANVSHSVIYEAAYAGEIKNFRINRAVRIPRDAVQAWIELQCRRTAERMASKPGLRRPA